MLRKVLYGLAVADALGTPLEFKTHPTSRDFDEVLNGDSLCVSDDTQMSLFLTEALLKEPGRDCTIQERMVTGHLRWYLTQTTEYMDGWNGLLSFRELFSTMAPGGTCMASCALLARNAIVNNDSKGNGTVMRCAPISHVAHRFGGELEWAMETAGVDAEITHLHPRAKESSVRLAEIHYGLASGFSLTHVLKILQHDAARDGALDNLLYRVQDREVYFDLRNSLGGWVAEEAITLAVGAVLHNDNFVDVCRSAAQFQGDSDTVASIAGGLAAAEGMEVPPELIAKLNVLSPIEYVLSL